VSQKKTLTLHKALLLQNLEFWKKKCIQITLAKPIIGSLEVSNGNVLLDSGKFFKKIAFFCLAFNLLCYTKYKLATMRSILLVIWDTLATNNVIF
jgi:hypothetical protein